MTQPDRVRYLISAKDLPARLARWQEELRLGDWNITAEIARGYAFDTGSQWERAAQINFHRQSRTARIQLLDPNDYPPDWLERDQDMERDLVHELIHLHLVWTPAPEPDSMKYHAEEFACEAIADALVKTRRSNP